MNTLVKSLIGNKTLEDLKLSHCQIDDADAEDIFSKLICDTESINSMRSSNHTLKRLSLQRKYPQETEQKLLDLLLTMNMNIGNRHDVGIRKILQYHPNIDMSALFELGGDGERTLKSLPYIIRFFMIARHGIGDGDDPVSVNELDKRKLTAIYQYTRAMSLRFVPTPHIRRVEQNDPTLTTITIGGDTDAFTRFASSLGDDYDHLGVAIGNNQHLTGLNITLDTPAGDVALDSGFFDGLKRNSSICKLNLDGTHHNHRTLLSGGIIHEVLDTYQENNTHLTHLKVGNVLLQNGGEEILTATFQRCTRLIHIILQSCRMTAEQLLPMVDIFRGHPSLEILDLHHNQIGNVGCDLLATLLVDQNCNLRVLKLGSNHIDNEGVATLANSLVINRKLKHLEVSGNPITPSIKGFFSNLTCNTTNINTIYSSNHTLVTVAVPSPHQHRKSLLRMKHNQGINKRHVAIKKILEHHPNIDMEPFYVWGSKEGEWTLKALPFVIAWFERAKEAVDESLLLIENEDDYPIGALIKDNRDYQVEEKRLSAIYQFARDMPLLFVPTSHINTKAGDNGKKRKRDDM